MAKAPDMSRDKDLAGQTVSKGGYNITYDENGYATKATNYKHDHFAGTEKSVAAKSSDTVKSSSDRSSYGGSSYDQDYFSDSELQQAAELRDLASSGQITWAEAHDYVERVRGKYGYSGGTDGSEYIKSDLAAWDPDGVGGYGGGSSGGLSGGFSYGNAPSYVNRYQSQIDDLTAQILNREAFSYNPETDPTYQQYKESYTRNGERAMQDTLGQVSARTGGLASSYAGSAAQQTYDNYMSALSDKIPELRQLAYSMYQDEGNTMRANLEMLMALEQGDYAKYADLLAQYNTDRSFDYGVYRDDISDQRYNTEWNYQVGRDQIADQRYDDETAWERSQYASETEYNQALAKAQTLAAAGDFSGYKALGYSDAEIANLKTAYDKAQAAARSTGSGSKSSGSSSSKKPTTGIVDTMLGLGNDTKAYEYLVGLDLSASKTDNLWALYETARDSAKTSGSVPTFNDYSEAVAYMRQNGVPNGNASGAMTKSEWTRRKASYQQYGQGGTEVTEYDSYSAYLTAYVQYCLSTYGG